MRLHRFALAVLCVLPLLASCGAPPEPAAPDGTRADPFVGRGVIQSVSTEPRALVIQHEEIPGFMAAMTMSFPVADEVPLEALRTGDEVVFSIERLNGDRYQVFRVDKVGAD